jgi:hypothetical protein
MKAQLWGFRDTTLSLSTNSGFEDFFLPNYSWETTMYFIFCRTFAIEDQENTVFF